MWSRRRLVSAAALLAAGRLVTARDAAVARASERLERDPFPMGVAAGDLRPDGFVLWTRAMGLTGDVRLNYEIAHDGAFRNIVRRGTVFAPARLGHSAHAVIRGLPAGRQFHYRFHLRDAVSRTGQVATLPQRTDRVRLALTSCQHYEQGWFTAYRDMIAQAPDAVLQVGDYIYEKSFGSGPDVRSFRAPDPRTLDDYRARYALYHLDPDLQAARAAFPFLVMWDDHEVENDYAGANGVETADPARFIERRAAAYQAYFEHMPIDPRSVLATGGIDLFRRYRWGDLATVHLVDGRQYRSVQPCSSGKRGGGVARPCADRTAATATMLGRAQSRWLAQGLAQETARWSLVAQQTLVAPLRLPQSPDAFYSDLWDGYPAAREELLRALGAPAVRNAVVLGGDVHSFWVNDLNGADGRIAATELVTTCLASRNGPPALFEGAQARNPHVRYHDNAHAGWMQLDVTARAVECDLRVVNDLRRPDSPSRSLARCSILDGLPGARF
jgi:alkaline phosphatase D